MGKVKVTREAVSGGEACDPPGSPASIHQKTEKKEG